MYGLLFLEQAREISAISLNKSIKKNNRNIWDLEIPCSILGTCAICSTSLVLGFNLYLACKMLFGPSPADDYSIT